VNPSGTGEARCSPPPKIRVETEKDLTLKNRCGLPWPRSLSRSFTLSHSLSLSLSLDLTLSLSHSLSSLLLVFAI